MPRKGRYGEVLARMESMNAATGAWSDDVRDLLPLVHVKTEHRFYSNKHCTALLSKPVVFRMAFRGSPRSLHQRREGLWAHLPLQQEQLCFLLTFVKEVRISPKERVPWRKQNGNPIFAKLFG